MQPTCRCAQGSQLGCRRWCDRAPAVMLSQHISFLALLWLPGGKGRQLLQALQALQRELKMCAQFLQANGIISLCLAVSRSPFMQLAIKL